VIASFLRWFSRISPRERAIVLGGGAILVLVLAWLFIVTPLLERNTATADLVPERERLLVRRMDLLARRAQIAAELQAANTRLEQLNTRLLTAAAPAVAASELQKLVKDMAAEARTEIRSERILPPEERGELLEIPVEIAVSAEIRQLVDLLARVEGAQKLLTVKDLRVRVVNVSQPRELLATLTVSGFILPPGKTRA
jgi:type II secretory pathway component PulM